MLTANHMQGHHGPDGQMLLRTSHPEMGGLSKFAFRPSGMALCAMHRPGLFDRTTFANGVADTRAEGVDTAYTILELIVY